jgi:hypothetical protein
MPRLISCGSRGSAYQDFKTAMKTRKAGDYVALWIDSEDPLADLEAAWEHLKIRDGWAQPPGATDDQVFFMTTCMESLIVADRAALQEHYGSSLQMTALPPLLKLEVRSRQDVQQRLVHATRNCTKAYAKGKKSFELLATLTPEILETHLPSFARTRRILDQKLN